MAAGNYDALIASAAARHNIDQRLLRAVLLQESDLGRDTRPSRPNDPDSPVGIAQMRPSTMRGLLGPNADPRDPVQAIDAAAAYLDQGVSAAEKAGITNPGAYAVAHYTAGPNTSHWGDPAVANYVRGIGDKLTEIGGPGPSPAGGASAPADAGSPGLSPRLAVGSQAAQSLGRVDPRLTNIISQASSYLPQGWHADVTSGFDDRPSNPSSLHPKGLAIDVQLYDDQGRKIPNYQSPATFRTYEQFAQGAKLVQMANYPELNDQFAWGGYFHNQGLGHYGAADLMHFSLGEHPAAGDWAGGLNAIGKSAGFDAGAPPSQGLGNLAQYAPDLSLYRLPGTASRSTGSSAAVPATSPDVAASPSDSPAVVSSVSQPVYNQATGKFEQRPRPPAPAAADTPAAPPPGAPGTGSLDVAMANVPSGIGTLDMPRTALPRPSPMTVAPTPLLTSQLPPSGVNASAAIPPGAAPPSAVNPLVNALIPRAEAAAPPAPARVLSDAEIAKIQPGDVLGMVGRSDLTDADRAAIDRRLSELQAQPSAP